MTGQNVDSEKIYTEGITKITADDFVYANAAGKTIKLLAKSQALANGQVLAMVAPFLLDKEHPLGMVNDVFNAVFVTGNMLGDSMYYGRGAGKLPTASAVVSDVIDCARHLGKTIMCFWEEEDAVLADQADVASRYFVRADVSAKEQVLAAFGPCETMTVPGRENDFAVFTDPIRERDFEKLCESLGAAVLSHIRMF